MNSSFYNSFLRNFKLKSPVVFTFHINWNMYEQFSFQQYNHIKNTFLRNGIENFEFLPILTDARTDMENRIKQFKRGMEKIADKYEKRCHVIGYSFAGVIPRGYISIHNGDEYIQSLLTIGTPNQGSHFVNLLISRDYQYDWFQIEPVIRAVGAHQDWLKEEYSSKSMHDFNSFCINSTKVKYNSVGGRREKLKASESLRFIHETMSDNLTHEIPSDGLIVTKEVEFGNHLMNFDADHFELIGMRPNTSAIEQFKFYANTVKNNDSEFMEELKISSEPQDKETKLKASK